MVLMVHSSLSSLGHVRGGAATVVRSLRGAVGPAGTVVVPTLTPHVADPAPECVGVPSATVQAQRASVPLFQQDTPSSTGAIAEAVRLLACAERSGHPQASVAAVGAHAAEITREQSLAYAIGRDSPFGKMHELGAHVLLMGVGHNRNTFLHYVESLLPRPRLKVRRFPWSAGDERVWVETEDVADDNDTHFPVLGEEFERWDGVQPVRVGNALCRVVSAQALVRFATARLDELLCGSGTVRGRAG
ncbi:aminoglycoside N(3)-acetyltransferase [Allosaccharopolyspora coralli]|nr:AAC(3) family N-acetyltransferase [Allosaccharopolyspora coralli]